MSTKRINGIVIPRHDTAINWAKANTFVPEAGELIIFTADTKSSYTASELSAANPGLKAYNADGEEVTFTCTASTSTRFKFGDGNTNVNALPFVEVDADTSSQGTSISKVSTLANGYKIELTDGTSLTLRHGEDGTSVEIEGSVETVEELDGYKSTATKGDGYIVNSTGHLWVFNGSVFVDAGEIKGPQGIGIDKIEKTSTSGLIDTYTITFTDNSTTTFTVTNGQDGESLEADSTYSSTSTNAQSGVAVAEALASLITTVQGTSSSDIPADTPSKIVVLYN